MTTPLPTNWEELIAGYTLGNLDPEEAEEFAQLLLTHPDLTTDVEAMQATLGLLPQVDLPQTPPVHLRSKILRAAETGSIAKSGQAALSRSRSAWGVAGTIAALILLVLGLDSWRLRQELDKTRQALRQTQQELRESRATIASLQQSRPRLFQLTGAGTTQTASGKAIIQSQSQEMLLTVSDLPPLPAGEAYRVWAFLDGNSKPIYCGQFETNAQGTLAKGWRMPQPVADAQVTQLVITAENSSAPPVPAGTKVMESVLQEV